jgi:hypothetical protein
LAGSQKNTVDKAQIGEVFVFDVVLNCEYGRKGTQNFGG